MNAGASVPHPSRPVEIATGAARPAPLVVKIGGALLENAADNRAAFEGLVALHRAQPGGIVLVHGGGAQVDRQLKRVGIETPRIEGIRVTSREAIEQVVGVLAGSAHMQLLGILASLGARPVGLSLSDGGLCACRRTTKYAFDPGEVGEIVGGDATVARTLLVAGFMPVVNSIGLSPEGDPLNVNADEAACAIARVAHASGLLLLSDVPGVLDASKSLLAELDAAQIEALIADGTISGGMIPKVRSALDAAAAAGCPVTIASWREPARALSAGGGTRIHAPAAACRAG